MTPDPAPNRLVPPRRRDQLFPQITVSDGLSSAVYPVPTTPALQVHRHALLQIKGIGDDGDLACFSQDLEAPDRRQEFHAVIGCLGLAAL